MNNVDIRHEVTDAGLHLWQVAERLGIADYSLSRRLRHELSTKEKNQIRSVITRIKEEEFERNSK